MFRRKIGRLDFCGTPDVSSVHSDTQTLFFLALPVEYSRNVSLLTNLFFPFFRPNICPSNREISNNRACPQARGAALFPPPRLFLADVMKVAGNKSGCQLCRRHLFHFLVGGGDGDDDGVRARIRPVALLQQRGAVIRFGEEVHYLLWDGKFPSGCLREASAAVDGKMYDVRQG